MQKLTEEIAVIGTIDPQTLADTEVWSDIIDMSKYWDVMAVALLGNMNDSTGTLVFRAVTCDSAGNNAAALKTASTLAVVADNKQVVIEVSNEDLAGGGNNANRYIKFGMISGSTGGPAGAIVLGRSKNGPASDDDLSTVAEIEIDKD